MKRSILIALALASFAIGGLAAYLVTSRGQPGAPSAVSVGRALVGGPFQLTDHTGKRVTDKDFHGRHMLVLFGSTGGRVSAPMPALGAEPGSAGGGASGSRPGYATGGGGAMGNGFGAAASGGKSPHSSSGLEGDWASATALQHNPAISAARNIGGPYPHP